MCMCFLGQHESVKLLLKKHADPFLSDKNGWNALHYENLNCIKSVLSLAPALVNSKENSGMTPLMIAANRVRPKLIVTYCNFEIAFLVYISFHLMIWRNQSTCSGVYIGHCIVITCMYIYVHSLHCLELIFKTVILIMVLWNISLE